MSVPTDPPAKPPEPAAAPEQASPQPQPASGQPAGAAPPPSFEPADPFAGDIDRLRKQHVGVGGDYVAGDKISGDTVGKDQYNINGPATINYNIFGETASERRKRRQEQVDEDRAQAHVAAEQKEKLFTDEGFALWFYGDETAPGLATEERYYVLAASLFEGIAWNRFLEIHRALLGQVNLLDNEDAGLRIQSSGFDLDEEELAKRTFVERINRQEDSEFGPVTSAVVGFASPGIGSRVLEIMRRKHTARLRDVLPVIRSYGMLADPNMRARAAEAAAEIAQVDFDYVWRSVVVSWAHDNNNYVRSAVGDFVYYLLNADAAVGNLLRELHNWSDPAQTADWKLRWSAAAAYKDVASSKMEPALAALKNLSIDDDNRVKEAVAYSLITIYEDGSPGRVLETLADWAMLPERKRDQTAEDIDRNTLATWTFLALTVIDFETDGAAGISNLFTLLAQSPQSKVAGSAAAILMPDNRQPFNFVTAVLRAWAKSELSSGKEAAACTLAALYERVDDRLRTGILNLVDRWQQAARDTDLVDVAQQAMSYIQAS